MFMNAKSLTITVLALLACGVQTSLGAAAPTQDKRDVFVPPVLYPHNGTVWAKGQKHNVTWDVTQAPKQITNKRGVIMLRKGSSTTPVVLASGFDIRSGRTVVTVPWVVPDSDYSLVLFGDSGNFSPQFTINGPAVF